MWYFRNRYLDPRLGRFLTRDGAGYRDGLNMYAYVRNNPLRFTDPDGRTARPGYTGQVDWAIPGGWQPYVPSMWPFDQPVNFDSAGGAGVAPALSVSHELAISRYGADIGFALPDVERDPRDMVKDEYIFTPYGAYPLFPPDYGPVVPNGAAEKALLAGFGALQRVNEAAEAMRRRLPDYYTNPLLVGRDLKDTVGDVFAHTVVSAAEGYQAGVRNMEGGGSRAESMQLAFNVTLGYYFGGKDLYEAEYGEDWDTGEKIGWKQRGGAVADWTMKTTGAVLGTEAGIRLLTRPNMAFTEVSARGAVAESGAVSQTAIVRYDPVFAAAQRASIAQGMGRLTARTSAELAANPGLATGVLSRAEYIAATESPAVARMGYGNAVERLAAQRLDASQLGSWVEHAGGPGRPDFVTRYPGMNFEITTPTQVPAHLARPYGPGLEIFTYRRPEDFVVFPKTR